MGGARELSCDYLIVGAGASGIAFLEEVITSSPDLTAVIVDCRAAPGGHWVDSYRKHIKTLSARQRYIWSQLDKLSFHKNQNLYVVVTRICQPGHRC